MCGVDDDNRNHDHEVNEDDDTDNDDNNIGIPTHAPLVRFQLEQIAKSKKKNYHTTNQKFSLPPIFFFILCRDQRDLVGSFLKTKSLFLWAWFAKVCTRFRHFPKIKNEKIIPENIIYIHICGNSDFQLPLRFDSLFDDDDDDNVDDGNLKIKQTHTTHIQTQTLWIININK